MADRLTVEEHHTPEHTAASEAMQALGVHLNRAALVFVLRAELEYEEQGDDAPRGAQFVVIAGHLVSAVNTLASILRLTESLNLHVKDAVALARVYYESLLVAAFTASDDGTRARRAELYSVYRTFHGQSKVWARGGVTFHRHPRLSRQDERVKAALALFKEGGGGRCFPEDRPGMIESIATLDSRAGLTFDAVEGMIHEVSSEIIHGSYYGHQLFHSLQHPGTADVENLMAHYESVLFTVCLSTVALARTLQHLEPSPLLTEIDRLAMSALSPSAPDEVAALLARKSGLR